MASEANQALRGFGLGYRTAFYEEALAAEAGRVDWYEVVSENFMGLGGRPRRYLERLRERFPVAMHGVSLSIASREPVHRRYLAELKALADVLQPAFVSDHICWTTHRGRNTHDLLPVVYTEEQLRELVRRVDEVQEFLGRRLYLENPSAYVAPALQEMDEGRFLAELVRRSGCGLILDLNNAYVCHRNLGLDPLALFDALPGDAIAYFHLAGHTTRPDVLIDTHDQPVAEAVWQLYHHAVQRWPSVPTMIEWDDKLPAFGELLGHLDRARLEHDAAKRREILDVADQPETSDVAKQRETRTGRANAIAPSTHGGLTTEPLATAADRFAWYEAFHSMMTGDYDEDEVADPRLQCLAVATPVPRATGMSVYHDAYLLRLVEVARALLPVFSSLVSEDMLGELLQEYFVEHPPAHFSVKYSVAALPDWLNTGGGGYDFGVPASHIADVVRLEWELERIRDLAAPDESCDKGVLGALRPEEWETLTVMISPLLVAIETSCRAGDVLASAHAGERPSRPPATPARYLIYRHDTEVRWREIDERQHAFTEALREQGRFLTACASYAERWGLPFEEGAAEAAQHLVMLFDLGVVTGINTTADATASFAEAIAIPPPPPPAGESTRT